MRWHQLWTRYQKWHALKTHRNTTEMHCPVKSSNLRSDLVAVELSIPKILIFLWVSCQKQIQAQSAVFSQNRDQRSTHKNPRSKQSQPFFRFSNPTELKTWKITFLNTPNWYPKTQILSPNTSYYDWREEPIHYRWAVMEVQRWDFLPQNMII